MSIRKLQKPRILLAEDNASLRTLMAVYLAEIAEQIDECPCGKIALRRYSEQVYDLMIFDVMLPGCSGLDLLKYVRRRSTCPVIMMSAIATYRCPSLDLGASLFLIKPIRLPMLVRTIGRMLSDGIEETTHLRRT